MDLTEFGEPRTDQQNFINYKNGPKTVTVSEVRKVPGEQPLEIHLVEFPGQPYKPSRGMVNVLLGAWGKESDNYLGRKITLYGDPKVRFGGNVVGGIKISHLSHIDKPARVLIRVSKGKNALFTVQPLAPVTPLPAARDWLTELELAGDDLDAISALGSAARGANVGELILGAIREKYQTAKGAANA